MPSHNPRKGKQVSVETLGAEASFNRQEVEPQTTPESGLSVISSIVSPAEEGQGHATMETLFFDSTAGQAWPYMLQYRRNKRGDLELDTITRVDPTSSPSALSLTIRAAGQVAETKDRAIRTETTVSSHGTLYDLGYERERAGGAKTSYKETIIANPGNSSLALPNLTAEGTVDAKIEKLDSGAAVKTESILLESQPTLPTWTYDQRTGLPILELRKIINTSDVPLTEAGYNSARTALSLTIKDSLEYQPIDKWLSVQIVSKIPSTIDPTTPIRTYVGTENYSFPNVLNGDGCYFFDLWAAVYDSTPTLVAFDHDFGLHLEIIEGYSGPCRAYIREYLTTNPANFYTDNPTLVPTKINPQAFKIEGGIYTITSAPSCNVSIKTWDVPETIQPGTTIGYNSQGTTIPPGGTSPSYLPDISLPATSPGYTPASVILNVQPELWRSGVYLMKVIKVYHPGTTTPDGVAITFP